jgi:hypothetical protein
MALTGCSHLFHASGKLASDGGILGAWSSTPEGCTRDPVDGQPAAKSSSVLAFLWDDPSVRDPLRDIHRFHAPNAPMRLELARIYPASSPTYTLKLDTVKTTGITLNRSVCSTLEVQTHETPRTLPEGQPTLSGSLQLDCRVHAADSSDSHITANIRFDRCEY